MQAAPRKQEVIDELTTRIERTDVKGSGFIQFPPQRPFSERLEQQPPTLSHQANPELYQRSGPASAPQRPAAPAGRGGGPRPQHSAYASAQQPRPAAQYQAPPQSANNPYRPQQHASSQPQQRSYQAPHQATNGYDQPRSHQPELRNGENGAGRGAYSGGRGGPPGRGAPVGRTGVNGRGRGGTPAAPGRGAVGHPAPTGAARPPPAASQPRSAPPPEIQQARPAAAAVPRPAAPPSDEGSDTGQKLTKSQLKRLMKKKREGKS